MLWTPGLKYTVWPAELRSHLVLPELTRRNTPFYIGEPIEVVQTIEVFYPSVGQFRHKPVEIKHRDQYRSLELKTWDVGQKSVYQYRYQSFKDAIAAEDIAAHKKFIGRVLDDMKVTYQLSQYDRKSEAIIGRLYNYLDKEVGEIHPWNTFILLYWLP